MVTIDGLTVDAVVSFAVNHTAEVTSHPIESGADPTDHVRVKPVTIQLEGVQTATPLGDVPTDPRRPRAFYESLVRIQTGRRLITVTNEPDFGTYSNMVLTDLSPPQTSTTGDALRFTASFQQVTVATSLVVDEPTAEGVVRSKKKLGKQITKPAAPADADDGKTRAAALFDFLTGQ